MNANMSANGFTEDDQVRIAQEVQARAGGKRTGLGFSLGEAQSDEGTTQYSRLQTSLSSNYSRQTHRESLFSCKSDPKDTTKGEFPWDDGERGKCGPAHVRNEVRPSQPRDSQEQLQPKERDFPMIRDRDIEMCMMERNKSERKERRRSRSRSEDRERSRSRWRSMESEREERNRQDERYRERDRDRRRDSSRDRRRDSSRDRRRDSSRDRRKEREQSRKFHDCREDRYRDQKCVPCDESHHEKRDRWAGSNIRKEPHVLTSEQAKAAVKRKLKAATDEDESLRIGSKARVGGGVGWERPEMSEAAEFFTRDEIAVKGGVASVAPEYNARIAQIHAVEDEETTCLGDALGRQIGEKEGAKSAGTIESRTTKHHEAIFAPTVPFSRGDDPPVSTMTTSSAVGSEVSAGATAAAFTSPSVVGAAIRTRLALKGKSHAPKTDNRSQYKFRVSSSVKNQSLSQANEDHEEGPLFRALKVGDSVEARYTADGKWYSAAIMQVIHGGYEIARYKVRYVDYGNEETLPWKRIKRLTAATSIPLEVKPSAATEICTSEVGVHSRSSAVPLGVSNSDGSPSLTAGLVLPSLGVDESQPPSKDLAESPGKIDKPGTDIVNPNILMSSGRGMSWKQKIKAKKSGSSVGLESESRGVSLLPPEVSLLLGSKEPEQVSDDRGCLNNNQWRAKVTFGMNGNNRA